MAKYAAKGLTLQYENPPLTWVTVPNVGDISLNLGEADEIDVTTHDSPGGFREFIAGFKNAAEFTIPLVYDPALTTHAYLRTQMGGVAVPFRVGLPMVSALARFNFSGLIRGFEVGAAVDGRLEATVTVKPTGDMTYTTA